MDDATLVQCPYCLQMVELWVDPDTRGQYIEDCEVCCRPWRVNVARDDDGTLHVTVTRAQ